MCLPYTSFLHGILVRIAIVFNLDSDTGCYFHSKPIDATDEQSCIHWSMTTLYVHKSIFIPLVQSMHLVTQNYMLSVMFLVSKQPFTK